MRKINKKADDIQRRFFYALDIAVSNSSRGDEIQGLKGFCVKYKLHRGKYSNIRSDMNTPERKQTRVIDIDALAYLCEEFNISAEWLLLGKGGMYK